MRKTLIILLSIAITMALATGCQATPDKPVVIQKDMEQMIDSAKEGDEDTVILKALDVPDIYQKDLTSAKGNVIVNVDANVVMPNTDKIPTATVDKQVFSQEIADKLMELLLQGQTLYDMEEYEQMTKAEIQEKLVKYYAMRAGTIPVNVDGEDSDSVEVLDETIDIWEKELRDAPEEASKTPAQTIFHKREMPGFESEETDCIEGIAEIGGEPARFLVENGIQENRIFVEFYRNINVGRHYHPIDILTGKLNIDAEKLEPEITAEEAQAQADVLIEKLGLPYKVCARTELCINLEGGGLAEGDEPDYNNLPTAHIVRYVRMVEGVPITYTCDTGTRLETEENYAKPWPYEAISIVIDDTGIIEFNWTSPYTDPEIVTGDTNLMPFADIQDVFEKMVIVKYSYFEEGTLQLNINSVQLGLMRVTNPNQRDSGLLIPVWDFIGDVTAFPENGESYQYSKSDSLLTINAIDGTIIDRGFGY